MRVDSFAGAGKPVAGGEEARRGYNKNEEETPMAVISMKHLLEAGVHFGHQTRRWNPKWQSFP